MAGTARTGATALVEVHGLRVCTPFDLHGRPAGGAADIELLAGDPREVRDCLPGEVLLGRVERAARPILSVFGDGRGWRMVFHGVADAIFDAGASRVVLHGHLGADEALDALAAGPVLALALAARGTPVLHASVVVAGGVGVAIVGPSGTGKTTLAALACAAGATLLTDDTLVVAPADGGFACLPGSRQLRLRPGAAELAARLPGAASPTADGRVGVTVGPERLEPAPLRAVVVPVWSERAGTFRRIIGGAATRALLASSRTPAFAVPEAQLTFFRLVSAVASRVPVYELPVVTHGSPPAEVPGPLADLLFASR